MQFVLFIYQGTTPLPGSDAWTALSEVEQQTIYADYGAVNGNPGVTSGLPLGLPAVSTTVHVQAGAVRFRQGIYQAEAPGGYLVLDAPTMDAAIELAAKIPAARLGGAIEIRPVEQYW